MKRKIVSIFMICIMAVSLFAGCGKGDTQENAGLDIEEGDVTLTLATWNLGTEEENNINRRMIKEFEKKTGIKIEIADNIDTENYDESLAALAAAGKLPDIIMMTTTPYGLENEWFADISDMAAKDDEWKNIPEIMEETVHYKDGIYYVPVGFYMVGYYVNEELFDKYNIDQLEYGCSVDDFMNAIKKLTNPNDKTVGILNEVNIMDWYPASQNKNLGWYTWDGEKYNLDSPEFAEGIKLMKEIQNGKYSLQSMSEDELAAMDIAGKDFDEKQDNAWYEGKVGIRYAGTWNSLEMMTQKSNFKTRFIGIPGGRTAMVNDFMGITPQCKHKEEAYEFLKWMSFSEEGIKTRMSLDETGTEDYNFPVTNKQELIDAYCDNNTYPGFKEALSNLDNCITELNKFQPGYFESRSYARTGRKIGDYDNASMDQLYDAVWKQGFNFADYAEEANRIANEQYKKAVEEIEKIY